MGDFLHFCNDLDFFLFPRGGRPACLNNVISWPAKETVPFFPRQEIKKVHL